MGSETQIVRMEDAPLQIIDGDRGKNYPSRTDQLDEGFCLFLNAGNVTADGFKFDNTTFITKERDELLRKGKLKRKDIVITTRGTVGNVAFYDNKVPYEHLRINSGMVIIRTDENSLYPRYTYYFLKSRSFENQVQMLRTGSAQPQLPIRDINRIKIPIPALTEQKRIANILGTLDDKIELNQRMNGTLEAIARAVFKSWFVDFDPVRAKTAGEPFAKHAKHPLPDKIMALFPDQLVESELGMIPKGWEVSTINEEIELVGGGTPSTKNPKYWENGIHNFATPKDLSNLSSIFLLDTDRKVTKAGLSKISSGLLKPGTLLMSSRAPVGYLAINQIPVCINQGFIAMKCNKRLTTYYMLNWAKTHMGEIKARASGTTFSELSKRNFRPMKILVPSQEIIITFEGYLSSQFDQIKLNLQMIKVLLSQREELLKYLFYK